VRSLHGCQIHVCKTELLLSFCYDFLLSILEAVIFPVNKTCIA